MDPNKLISYLLLAFVVWKLSQMFFGKTSPAKAKALVQNGAGLIDVRSPAEFGSGHLQGAKNIPVQALVERLAEVGPREHPVVLYCASGMRSATAARTLRSAGFTQVFDLGAMSRWGG